MDTQLIDSPPRRRGEWVCGWLWLPALPVGQVLPGLALCRRGTVSWSEREGTAATATGFAKKNEALKGAKNEGVSSVPAGHHQPVSLAEHGRWTLQARAFSSHGSRRPISGQHMRCFLK